MRVAVYGTQHTFIDFNRITIKDGVLLGRLKDY